MIALRYRLMGGMLALATMASAQTQPEVATQVQSEAHAQDSATIRKIYDTALSQGKCYERLRHICKEIGPRLSGSTNAAQAVEYTYQEMLAMGVDTVFKQPCMVPHWERGAAEVAYLKDKEGKQSLDVCALGMSTATDKKGVRAKVVEVTSLEEVKAMPADALQGKIVFYNRPMNAKELDTFHAYGGCVDQRSTGAIEAGKQGAVAVVVRSMNLRADDFPHTGSVRYEEETPKIPAAAISTNGADLLSKRLKKDPNLEIYLKMNCQTLPDAPSHNVVGEIRGTEFPDEIIVVGGHLDSWDLGEGAHDDGAGIVQAMEVLEIFRQMGLKPKRTIRAVMFMNEENGMKGALAYEEEATRKGEVHIAALESDRGGFAPRGFTIEREDALSYVLQWAETLDPYFVEDIEKGYGGVDISPLRKHGTPLIGFTPDSQRYFDHHHSANDIFEHVNKRELEMGAAAMATLVYLISEYGMDGLHLKKQE